MAASFIKKVEMAAPRKKRSFEASVTKSSPLIKTTLVVASSEPDDPRFKDTELTPGPVTQNLDPKKFYVLGWVVAFGADGTARLKVRIFSSDGTSQDQTLSVQGKLGDKPAQRVVLIP